MCVHEAGLDPQGSSQDACCPEHSFLIGLSDDQRAPMGESRTGKLHMSYFFHISLKNPSCLCLITELIAWLNELLQVSYTKIEQCGTGGAYCQILDSIYGTLSNWLCFLELKSDMPWPGIGDVPMSRVKMNAKHEYEFLANYKIMQNVFKAKKIEKVPIVSFVDRFGTTPDENSILIRSPSLSKN